MAGAVELLAVRPDGVFVPLPRLPVRPGGYRFMPDGKALVYMPHLQSTDFWLLDLLTNRTRPLTHLSNRGVLRTFDVTPDGRHLAFDRSRDNANVVLIDLPRRESP
jgi:Tol biopolymer transport system component